MTVIDKTYLEMFRYCAGDAHSIQHFVKVHSYAAWIGRQEGLAPDAQETLELTALVHDIGIKPAMEKYGRADGPYQEKEGEPAALELLTRVGARREAAERAAFLVRRHHTFDDFGPDHRILLEADMLVNLAEGGATKEKAAKMRESVFRTEAGKALLDQLFGL